MKKIFRIFAIVSALSAAPWFNAAAAFLIRDGKLQTDLNANTNRLTNATDYVTASGVSVTNLAANLGGGTGTLYRVQSQVTGLGFTTPNGPTAILTGTVATAGSFADTNSVGVIATNAVNQSTNVSARLASNVWAAADSTTNYALRFTGRASPIYGIGNVYTDGGHAAVNDINTRLDLRSTNKSFAVLGLYQTATNLNTDWPPGLDIWNYGSTVTGVIPANIRSGKLVLGVHTAQGTWGPQMYGLWGGASNDGFGLVTAFADAFGLPQERTRVTWQGLTVSGVVSAADGFASSNVVAKTGGTYLAPIGWDFLAGAAPLTASQFSIQYGAFLWVPDTANVGEFVALDTTKMQFVGLDLEVGGTISGSGSGLTDLPIYVNGGTVAQTATGTVITVTGGGGASLPAQTAPFALECQHVSDAHGTNLTAFYSSDADALLSLSSVSATNAVNFAGVANQSTATLVTPSFVVWTVKIPELATNFTRLRWRAIDNQATAAQPTFTLSWNNGASFAVMTSVVSAASTATSNGYAIAGWTNGFQGRTVQIIGSFTAASTNNLNTRFQGVEASQQSPLWSVE